MNLWWKKTAIWKITMFQNRKPFEAFPDYQVQALGNKWRFLKQNCLASRIPLVENLRGEKKLLLQARLSRGIKNEKIQLVFKDYWVSPLGKNTMLIKLKRCLPSNRPSTETTKEEKKQVALDKLQLEKQDNSKLMEPFGVSSISGFQCR